MKIRVLRNLGKGLPDYSEGQEVETTDAEADLLVKKLRVAEILEATPKPKKVAPVESEAKPVPAPKPKKPTAAENPVGPKPGGRAIPSNS